MRGVHPGLLIERGFGGGLACDYGVLLKRMCLIWGHGPC